MTGFDYAVLCVLGLSLLVGVLRGLLREVVTLAGWIAAFVLATGFSGWLARYMPQSLGPMLAQLLAFAAIFVGVLIAAGLTGLVLALIARSAGLGASDRVLGGAFGAARGMLIVLAVVLVAGLTPLPREPFWRDAVLSGPFETAVVALRPFLPEDLGRRIRYRTP
jgi:membrane protein required for colicin V production